jgi:hypothetical protein
VIISERMLKFHPGDRRREVRDAALWSRAGLFML